MKLEFEDALNDCAIELTRIQGSVMSDRFSSNNRFLISYAVVKASGTVERVVKQMLYEKISNGATQEGKEFLTRVIVNASYNPSPGKIEQLLGQMNTTWAVAFKETVNSDDKAKLKSLVNLRNSFAHGDTITVPIEDIIAYFEAGKNILSNLNNILYAEI